MANLRFTHLELENWRNFRQLSVDLQRRVFVVGPNASGKSNLLDAFRFLSDVVAVGGGFQEAVAKRGGVSRIRCLAARKNPQIGIKVYAGDDERPRRWEYELRFTHEQRGRRRPIIRKEVIKSDHGFEYSRPTPDDQADSELLTQTAIEQVTLNRDFREMVAFLGGLHYLHIVPQLIREPDRSVGKTNDPFGGDFLEQLARTSKRKREARLRKINRALRVAVPQLDELRLEQDKPTGTWHLRGRYQHWRPQGAWQDEYDFSDGTLRLLGLLWALLDDDDNGCLLLEEPELSLHPAVVRKIPQIFSRIQQQGGRQIILSTQSADLLMDSGIGLDEVLLLAPGSEGTSVRVAATIEQTKTLLESGLPLAEAVLPLTEPEDVEQLPLFAR